MSETDGITPGTVTWRGAVLLDFGYSGDDQYHSYRKVAQREFGEDREPDARSWVETILREVDKRAPVGSVGTSSSARYFGQLERGRYNELLPGDILWETQTDADPRFVVTITAGETITWSDSHSHSILADNDFYSSRDVPVLFSDASVDQWLADPAASTRSYAPGQAHAVRLAKMSFTSGDTRSSSASNRWKQSAHSHWPTHGSGRAGTRMSTA